MRTLLATTMLVMPMMVMPMMAIAQSPQAIFTEGAQYLGDMGLTVGVGQMAPDGGDLLLVDFTLSGENRTWGIQVPEMMLRVEQGQAVLEPEGVITGFFTLPALPAPVEFTISEDNLMVSVFLDARRGELAGFEIGADRLSVATSPAARDTFGIEAVLDIRDMMLTEREDGGVMMSQTARWNGLSVMAGLNPDPERESAEIMVDLGPFEMEMETARAGLLEEFPWVAAIGAGMRVEMEAELARSGVTTIIRPSADSVPNIQQYEIGRMMVSGSQVDPMTEMSVSMMSPSVSITRPDGRDFAARFDDVKTDIAWPMHQSTTPVLGGIDLSVEGGAMEYLEEVVSVRGAIDLDVGVLPLIDWFDYSIVSGEGNWRDPSRVFAIQDIIMNDGVVHFGDDTITISSQLDAVDNLMLGLKDMVGTVSVSVTDMETVLSFMGASGFFTEFENKMIIDTLRVMFGEQAGLGGGQSVIDFGPGEALTINDMRLR